MLDDPSLSSVPAVESKSADNKSGSDSEALSGDHHSSDSDSDGHEKT